MRLVPNKLSLFYIKLNQLQYEKIELERAKLMFTSAKCHFYTDVLPE